MAVLDRPLGVLWRPVVLLDALRESREVHDLVVAQHPVRGGFGIEVDALIVTVGTARDQEFLRADPAVEDLRPGLGDDVRVDLDLTAYDDLAEPERAFDHDARRVTGRGINGEHHPGALRVDHALHHHCDGRLLGDVLGRAVGEHAWAEE